MRLAVAALLAAAPLLAEQHWQLPKIPVAIPSGAVQIRVDDPSSIERFVFAVDITTRYASPKFAAVRAAFDPVNRLGLAPLRSLTPLEASRLTLAPGLIRIDGSRLAAGLLLVLQSPSPLRVELTHNAPPRTYSVSESTLIDTSLPEPEPLRSLAQAIQRLSLRFIPAP